MAAMIASRRGASVAKLLEKMLVNPAPALEASSLSAVRSFKSNAQMRDVSDDERSLDVDRRSDERLAARRRRGDIDSPIFSGVFDPFNPTRSLSQVLNLMDQMLDSPYPASARGMARRGWDVREDTGALHLRVDMPGLGKEHVKVSAEQNTLIIKGEGEGEKEDPEAAAGRRYSSRIDLPEGLYKMDGIRAEMKNGVLKVTVPKVKEEKRKDAFQIQIE